MSTIHLANWGSKRMHGPGLKFSIMARPRAWEHGDGFAPNLTPKVQDLDDVKLGIISLDEYKRHYLERLAATVLAPGKLRARLMPGGFTVVLPPDSTLLCSCSVAAAARGGCHRAWAAGELAKAGWTVILDGKEVAP